MSRRSRRRFLHLGLSVVAVLAGCTDSQPESETGNTTTSATDAGRETSEATVDPDGSASTPSTTGTEGASPAESDELDLREANVVAVAVENRDGSYRFDVTLIHDDDGEDGYANWWQVEMLDGEQLGRRELLHAHGTREFTRSATIDIPPGTTCVVVRGHDQSHGYGGQAMLVNLERRATRAVQQGPERRSFEEAECP